MFFPEQLRYAVYMRFRTLLALAFIIAPICAFAQNSLSGLLYTFPDQHAEASKMPSVALAQDCENFLWASEIEFLARQQDVPLPQAEIVDRVYGGTCVDTKINLDKIKAVVDGERNLEDGTRVRLEMQITSGTLSSDDLLAQLIAGRSFIITWRGHPYVAVSALWDDYVYAPAQRLHKIREIKLLDLAKPADKQAVTFKPDAEELSELGTTVEIVCTKLTTNPWAPAEPAKW
jgi:hypothetical protein